MKITDVKVWLVQGIKYNWTLLKIYTDEGYTGVGEATNWPGSPIVYEAAKHIGSRIIGLDPMKTDFIWTKLYRDLNWVGPYGASMCAISGIDMALLDLKGKVLGVPCYDKTVNQLTSVISGFSENAVKISEDKVSTPFDYTAFTHSNTLPVRDRIYIAQQKVIKQLADESSCVIVGRCAASILKNHENCVNVFICAPIEQRVKRISAQHNVSAEEAEKIIKKKDKERKNYYRHKKTTLLISSKTIQDDISIT